MSCNHDPSHFCRSIEDLRLLTRRHFFRDCGLGVGKIALASMLAGSVRALGSLAATQPALGMANPLAVRPPHFKARAKRVIYLFQVGAPSQLDLFDAKPSLVKYDGQPIPAEFVKDQRYAFIEKSASLMSGRYK